MTDHSSAGEAVAGPSERRPAGSKPSTPTYLGLDLGSIAALLEPVTPAGLGIENGSSSAATTFARFAFATFSTLVEPGDVDAAAFLAALGPIVALQSVVERWEADRILDAVHTVDAATSAALADRMSDAVERWRPRVSRQSAIRSLESAARVGATLVTPLDELWPGGFQALGDGAPLAIWVRGDPARLTALDRSIALVGARAATGYGEHVASESAAGLSDRGFAIASGGAYGIDGAAHRATIASEQITIAFLAGGVDRLYPAGHADLLGRIADTGLLIGELPCGSAPTRWRFLQRNRLIAAASRATVVVEAGRRSGSLNTAGHAAAIGRPLGAVPGPVTSPASAGCHRLIREYDAVCVTTPGEMAELTGITDATISGWPEERGDPISADARLGEQTRVLDALSAVSRRTIREVAQRSGLSERGVVSTLGMLELDGAVTEREDGWHKVRR
ncbi:DNA-processing protein DprA [Leifsonia poae]|uniref:DNA-processing protein DprA n=1 Tax=Leifsonia poae TaxID=110933 RepID=UPI001CBCEAD2|nr:DNA-processing protein DprA [Leifsonia poae]